MSRLIEKTLDGIRLLGFSLAGEETVIVAPEYNVAFDVGRAPREVISIDNVCITHGHMDHAAGIAYYFSQRGFVGLPGGRVIVHRSIAQNIQQLMAVWAEIERHPSAGIVHGVEHLEEVELRRGLFVRVFDVNHCPGALGYTLVEKRHKLKAEFVGKTGPELVALKKQGVQIEENIEVPLLTYTGDTAVGKFLELDFVRNSRAVLLECTFFDREHCERARAGRHIHVNDLPRIFASLPDSQIMIVHTTRRTDMRMNKRILEKILCPSDLARCSLLMDRPHKPAPLTKEGPQGSRSSGATGSLPASATSSGAPPLGVGD
jgi:ribonuclease Z